MNFLSSQLCNCFLHFLSLSSPERKRRMSARVMTKREPSPAPSRPPSLRQSIPSKQAPQLVNGKAEAPAGGRTRSAARNSTHTPPVASSTQCATSNTQNTAGRAMFACRFMFTATMRVLEVVIVIFDYFVKNQRAYWGVIAQVQLHQPLKK